MPLKKNKNGKIGGAVSLNENLNVNISWCSFIENYSSGSGGAKSANIYSYLNVLQCVFKKIQLIDSVVLYGRVYVYNNTC